MLSRDTVRIICLYTFWCIAHFFASHYYPVICMPYSVRGFLFSPLMAPAAHCNALRWMINQGGATLCGGWMVLASLCMDVLSLKHR
jgi:hypothetical protein